MRMAQTLYSKYIDARRRLGKNIEQNKPFSVTHTKGTKSLTTYPSHVLSTGVFGLVVVVGQNELVGKFAPSQFVFGSHCPRRVMKFDKNESLCSGRESIADPRNDDLYHPTKAVALLADIFPNVIVFVVVLQIL